MKRLPVILLAVMLVGYDRTGLERAILDLPVAGRPGG